MSQFLYFLPSIVAADLVNEKARFNQATLRRFGLADVFSDVTGNTHNDTIVMEHRDKGPGGHSGVLLGYQRPDGRIPTHLGFYPQHQTWELRTPGLEAWIGWNQEQPPTPEDLARKRQWRGYSITDDSGNEWQVPIIRRPDDSTELPREMYLNGDGTIHEPVKDAYREYWEETGMVCQWFLNPDATDQEIGFSKRKAFDLAVRALGINYRFGHAEQRICKALDSTNYLTVLAWSVDKPRFDAVEDASAKKKSPVITPNTIPGSLADSAPTDLVPQTSG